MNESASIARYYTTKDQTKVQEKTKVEQKPNKKWATKNS